MENFKLSIPLYYDQFGDIWSHPWLDMWSNFVQYACNICEFTKEELLRKVRTDPIEWREKTSKHVQEQYVIAYVNLINNLLGLSLTPKLDTVGQYNNGLNATIDGISYEDVCECIKSECDCLAEDIETIVCSRPICFKFLGVNWSSRRQRISSLYERIKHFSETLGPYYLGILIATVLQCKLAKSLPDPKSYLQCDLVNSLIYNHIYSPENIIPCFHPMCFVYEGDVREMEEEFTIKHNQRMALKCRSLISDIA